MCPPGPLRTDHGGKSPISSSCAVSLFPVEHAPDAASWSGRRCHRQLTLTTPALAGFVGCSINVPLLRQGCDRSVDALVRLELFVEDTIESRTASSRLLTQDKTALVCISTSRAETDEPCSTYECSRWSGGAEARKQLNAAIQVDWPMSRGIVTKVDSNLSVSCAARGWSGRLGRGPSEPQPALGGVSHGRKSLGMTRCPAWPEANRQDGHARVAAGPASETMGTRRPT